jgi:hypothetical protein
MFLSEKLIEIVIFAMDKQCFFKANGETKFKGTLIDTFFIFFYFLGNTFVNIVVIYIGCPNQGDYWN